MRKFICISGKAQNGKDTSAKIFKNILNEAGYKVLIVHLADLLKFICKQYFHWNGEKDEYGRTLLQRIGTEKIRAVEPDYWINFLDHLTKLFEGEWDYIIVPDTRFPNELTGIKHDDTIVYHVRVVRPGFKSPLTKEQQNHPSEVALDDITPDFIIENKSDIIDLYPTIESIVNEIIRS